MTTPRCSQLSNGVTVLSAAMPQMASVAVGVWIGAGGRYESADRNGVSHFLEHMMFKGSRRRTAREISNAIEGVGGYLNAYTSEEHTCYYARAHHQHFGRLVEVLMEMVREPLLEPGEIAKERAVIKEEVAQTLDEPSQHVGDLLNECSWPGHPLGRPLTGTEETLDRLGRKEMLDYLRRHYVAPAWVVTAAGNLDHRELVRAVEPQSRKIRSGKRPTFEPAVSAQREVRVLMDRRKIEQSQIALGIRTCSRRDPARYAVRLLNAVLGENMSSRLFQRVREDHGFAYNIGSTTSFWEDTGDIVVNAGMEPGKIEPALGLVIREMRTLATRRVSARELDQARDYVLGQMDLALEGTENCMMALGEEWLGAGRVMDPGEFRQHLTSVTAENIRAVASEYFRRGSLNLAIVGEGPRKNVLESILRGIAEG